MSELSNIRVISSTDTSVTLGVTTDSYAGTLYVGMRTSAPYATSGDETAVIADAVASIENPAYGEQTVTVNNLVGGTEYHFGAVQQYGYDHADFDYTFEASRPLAEENLLLTCAATRHVITDDGIIQEFPPNTPVYIQGGLSLVPSYHQIIPDENREDFSSWAAVGCTATGAPGVTPYPGRPSYLITDTGGDADGEVSLTLTGLTTNSEGATNAYHIFNIFIYAPTRIDENDVWVQISNPAGTSPSKTWFNATRGVVGSSTNADGTKVCHVYPLAGGWYRVEHPLYYCLDADAISLQVKIVSGDGQETIVRDGTNKVYLFGANCSRLWYRATGVTEWLDRDRVRGFDYLDGFGDLLTASYVQSQAPLDGVSSTRDMACGIDYTLGAPVGPVAQASNANITARSGFVSSITSQGAAIHFYGAAVERTWVQQWFEGSNQGIALIVTGQSLFFRALSRMSHKTLIEGEDTEAIFWHNAMTTTQAPGTNPLYANTPINRLNVNHELNPGNNFNTEKCVTMIIHRAFFWNTSPGDQFLDDMYGNVVKFDGVSDFKSVEVLAGYGSNRVIDARDLVINCGNSTHDDIDWQRRCAWSGGTNKVLRYPFAIKHNQTNCQVYGAIFNNINTPNHTAYSITYNDFTETCNSTNSYWYPSNGPNCWLIGEKHLGGWDCFNPSGGLWTDGEMYPITIDRMYATLTRDDVIEADGGSSYLLQNSLLDGVGPFSSQPASNPGGGYIAIRMHDVLWRGHICPGYYNYRPHDSSKVSFPLTAWNALPASAMVKSWDALNLTYEFINVTCAIVQSTHTAEVNASGQWQWMFDRQTAECANNRILWLSVDPVYDWLSGPSWTVVTGQAAVDEWIAKRDAWLDANGGLIPLPGEDTEAPEWIARDAAYRQKFTDYRTAYFASQKLPLPPQGYDPELGFTDGPTSGTFTLTDYGFNLGLYQLRRCFTVGLTIVPDSTNMVGNILTMGHIVIAVNGDEWSLTTESNGIDPEHGQAVVTMPYTQGVPVLLRAGANAMGLHWLTVDGAYEDDEYPTEYGENAASARFLNYLWDTPVVTGTFGAFTITKFRLAPFQYRRWYTDKYWAGDAA